MKLIFILILLLSFSSVQSQDCRSNGVVGIEHKIKIELAHEPGGETFAAFEQDSMDQNYLVFTLMEVRDGYFLVNMGRIQEDERLEGWVKKTDALGIYIQNREDGLPLYSSPSEDSEISSYMPGWTPALFSIADCNGQWLKVFSIDGDKKFHGWLQPEVQCTDPYTHCN